MQAQKAKFISNRKRLRPLTGITVMVKLKTAEIAGNYNGYTGCE